jgi:hypothetical protein
MPSSTSWSQRLSVLLFVFTSGIPGMEQSWNRSVFGLRLDLAEWLMISCLGGALGGAMLATHHRLLGAFAGALAGPCGLIAIFCYVRGRQSVWSIELVVIQMLASAPAFGVYWLGCWALGRQVESPNDDSQDGSENKLADG